MKKKSNPGSNTNVMVLLESKLICLFACLWRHFFVTTREWVFIMSADQKEQLLVVWVHILLSSRHCVALKLPASDETPLHSLVIFLTRRAQGQRNGLFIDPERCHTMPCVWRISVSITHSHPLHMVYVPLLLYVFRLSTVRWCMSNFAGLWYLSKQLM